MASLPGLKVVRSKIQGYGVIATRDFAPGETVADVDGVLWHVEELGDDRYALWMGDDHYIDMVDQTRWINHSCDPNVYIDGELEKDGGWWAKIIAEKPIKAGDEIVYDYGFSPEVAEPCACGAATCRGWIVEEEELPRLMEMLGRADRKTGND